MYGQQGGCRALHRPTIHLPTSSFAASLQRFVLRRRPFDLIPSFFASCILPNPFLTRYLINIFHCLPCCVKAFCHRCSIGVQRRQRRHAACFRPLATRPEIRRWTKDPLLPLVLQILFIDLNGSSSHYEGISLCGHCFRNALIVISARLLIQ